MDSQFFECSVANGDLPYSSYPVGSSIPNRLFGSLKFDIRNSPILPSFTLYEPELFTTYIDSQEQHSSTDNLSEAAPFSNSSLELEYNNYFKQLSPSPVYPQDCRILRSEGPSYLQIANHNQNIKCALQELETALMAPDFEEPSLGGNKTPQTPSQHSRSWNQESQGSSHSHQSESSYVSRFGNSGDELYIERRQKVMDDLTLKGTPPNNLKPLLIACARALSENKLAEFESLVERARGAVSISGEPIQRLGAYLVEGLVARKESSGTIIYRALKCKEPERMDLLSYMHILYEICPYLKFGYMAANGAIAEACRNEDNIHIIDFQISQGTQWMTLLQALATRPGGAPHVRITGIDDPVSKYVRGDGLDAVGRRLAGISEKFNIPVEFHAIPAFAPEVTRDMLDVRPGEALAVNFPFQLHHTPDESVDVSNPRDELLRMVKSLSPKVVTLVEQESNSNTAPFVPRLIETLDYYLAMFESIDASMPRDGKERINVEQHCLARDIVNIIACEGKERVERHELLGKWRLRFMMAGFQQFPLNSYVNSVIRGLLRSYSEHFTLLETDGGILLGWKERNLVSASAWH